MLYPGRLCIPFGISCNLHCRYCYRDICRHDLPKFTEKNKKLMTAYIVNAPDSLYSVIASGGEPLLYWNDIVYLFDRIPRRIHKKIMTNGYYLTPDKIEYINKNDIEIHLSWDGKETEYLRGYDVLEDKLELIRGIQNLRILSVITNQNTDVSEVYQQAKNKLRRPFYFAHSVIQDTPYNQELIHGFDYDIYEKSLAEVCTQIEPEPKTWYADHIPTRLGFNYLLDGSVVGIRTLKKYGTIFDDKNTLVKKFYDIEDISFCKNKKCRIRNVCSLAYTDASTHLCRIEKIKQDVFHMLNMGGVDSFLSRGD
jgi:MoaA/NifB/PqqE/SkfB family radical SAM enzyme